MTHTENRFPLFAYERNGKCKLSPLVGESVSGADERGKGEQKRKNRNKCEQKRKSKISMSKNKK